VNYIIKDKEEIITKYSPFIMISNTLTMKYNVVLLHPSLPRILLPWVLAVMA
jgi:hypothetical protein